MNATGGLVAESFAYDPLNRLVSAQVSGQPQNTTTYDEIDNILTGAEANSGSGTTYRYRVRATDAAGNLGNYPNVVATPPTPQATVAVPLTGAQTAGNLNVVVVGWNDTTSVVTSVTDSAGNVYTRAVGPTAIAAGPITQSIYYARNIGAAAANANTITVQFSAAANYPDIRVLEYSGLDTVNPVDVTAVGTGVDSPSSTSAVTTTNANDLLFAANTVAHTTSGPGPGFVSRVITPDQDIAEDEIVTATGSYSASAPLDAGEWVMQMVAFKAASGAASGNNVLRHQYAYDYLGSLTSRTDIYQGTTVSESYGYDALNRLTLSGGSTGGTALPTKSMSYDTLGNVTNKSDVGTYTYPAAGAAHPHAVSSISGTVNGVANPGFTYDADGNLTAGAARSAAWTSFNLPATLTQGANSDAYLYGPEHQRIKETHQDASYVLFFGLGTGEPHYEQYVNGSAFNYRYYLYADGGMVGVVNEDQTGTRTTKYFHRDHLGSLAVITNDSGAVTEKLSYDAWGKRRNANGTDAAGPITSSIDRGYTGHEMLDSVGLVHMNGRIYDPTIGRVLSADPTVQAPGATQTYNRYTYVGNNPLSAVDPSGYVSVIHALIDGGGGYSDASSLPPITVVGCASCGIGPGPGYYNGPINNFMPGYRGDGGGGIGGRGGIVTPPTVIVLPPIMVVVPPLPAIVLPPIIVPPGTRLPPPLPVVWLGLPGYMMLGNIIGNLIFSQGKNDDGDSDDKQKKGKPERNVDQNKRVDDAASEAGLDKQQRRELGRFVEQESRKYGEEYSYGDILDAALRLKAGERLIHIK